MRKCKQLAHRGTKICKKQQLHFTTLSAFISTKKFENSPETRGKRPFLPQRQAFFPEFRPMIPSGIYFAGVEMLPCKLASAQIDAGRYRCGKNKQGACTAIGYHRKRIDAVLDVAQRGVRDNQPTGRIAPTPAGALPFAVKSPKAYPRSFVQHELSCRLRDTKSLNPFGNTSSPWQLRFLTLGHLLETKGLKR